MEKGTQQGSLGCMSKISKMGRFCNEVVIDNQKNLVVFVTFSLCASSMEAVDRRKLILSSLQIVETNSKIEFLSKSVTSSKSPMHSMAGQNPNFLVLTVA